MTAARLCEKLADLLLFIDRFEEARSAGLAGLALVRPEDTQQAARLHYLLGKVEFQQDHFDSALAAFAAAEELTGAPGLDDDQEWVELWLTLQVDEKFVIYYQRKEVERCAALIEDARPLVEARGGARSAWGSLGRWPCCTSTSAVTASTSRSSKRYDGTTRPPGDQNAGPWGSCAPSASASPPRWSWVGPYLARRFL